MRQKLNNILLLAPVVVSLACSFTPGMAFAAATFNVTGATASPGVGDQIISKFFPRLAGQSINGQPAGTALESLMNNAIQTELPNFINSVNQKLVPLQDPSAFLGAMANAGSAAGKVMPFDYVTDPTILSLSVAAGASETGFDSINDFKNFNLDLTKPLPAKGGGATLSAMLGLNLRAFDPPRWKYFDFSRLSLFVNFFAIDLNKPSGSDFDVNFKTFGLHGMYQLFDSHAVGTSGLLRWGGLQVGTGFDYSSLTVLFSGNIQKVNTSTQTSTIGNTNQTLPLNLSYSGEAQVGANIHVFSIPFEVMTHVQLGYILSLYVGGGFDLNFGSSSLAGNAAAPMEIDAINPNHPNDTSDEVVVAKPEALLNLSGNNSVTVSDFRAYGGLQLNLLAVAFFVQGGADTNNAISVNTGIRAFW